MSFEILGKSRPSASRTATAAVLLLSLLLLGIGMVFAYLLISGRGGNYHLGTLLSFGFLVAGLAVVSYAKGFVPFRKVSEDRREELLW